MWTLTDGIVLMLLLPLMFGNEVPTPYVKYTKEHKVHNIMLYPEKHSWCRPTPIKQIISHNGCHSIEMENNVCVGACFSFSVPRTVPETPGDDRLYYCDSCQPDTFAWTTVVLDCPENPSQKSLSKMVEVIENCTCNSVTNSKMYNTNSFASGESSRETAFSGDEDLSSESNSLPELQDLLMKHNQQKGSMVEIEEDDQDNYTNSSFLKHYPLLRAANISTRDRISNYTSLLQELEERRAKEEEEE